jgi:methionine sulfoxide reductase heme-binding subunit
MSSLKSQSFWIAMHSLVVVIVLAVLAWITADNYKSMASNPTQFVQRTTGFSALFCLLLTLAITPVRHLTGWTDVVRFRRTLGLQSFVFASLHFSTFLILDHGLDVSEISVDIVKRPFILLGIIAFGLLALLAATSTAKAKKRLGGARWKRLHQLVYPACALAIAHYFSLKKIDLAGPLVCALVLALLLGWRMNRKLRQR